MWCYQINLMSNELPFNDSRIEPNMSWIIEIQKKNKKKRTHTPSFRESNVVSLPVPHQRSSKNYQTYGNATKCHPWFFPTKRHSTDKIVKYNNDVNGNNYDNNNSNDDNNNYKNNNNYNYNRTRTICMHWSPYDVRREWTIIARTIKSSLLEVCSV